MEESDFYDGIHADLDEIRWCYLRASLLVELLEDDRVLDALIKQLEVPGKLSTLKRLRREEKIEAIGDQIRKLITQKTSLWFKVSVPEVFAASVFRSDLSDGFVLKKLYCDVRNEAQLLQPVLSWLEQAGFETHTEVPLSRKRIDALGFKERRGMLGLFGGKEIIGVELKNQIKDFDRGLSQMKTFSQYCHRTYLACSPALAAEVLARHAEGRGTKHWNSTVLDRMLEETGIGLLLVEGDDVYEWSEAPPHRVSETQLDEVLSQLS